MSLEFLKHFGIFDCNACSMMFIQLVNILDILLADILNLNSRSFTSKPSLNRISTIRNPSTSLSEFSKDEKRTLRSKSKNYVLKNNKI